MGRRSLTCCRRRTDHGAARRSFYGRRRQLQLEKAAAATQEEIERTRVRILMDALIGSQICRLLQPLKLKA
ncbi:hypothetical protein PIB30_062799 [Stylosanthes scabra]|uniref:Uncharacterized protein n=1 Tax=Stylosanthes scabra TaxID=79078 RepID=A0ABU6WMD7_9FABA|nr:hypothetical protein [Stylosanthes scabra]